MAWLVVIAGIVALVFFGRHLSKQSRDYKRGEIISVVAMIYAAVEKLGHGEDEFLRQIAARFHFDQLDVDLVVKQTHRDGDTRNLGPCLILEIFKKHELLEMEKFADATLGHRMLHLAISFEQVQGEWVKQLTSARTFVSSRSTPEELERILNQV